MSRHHHLLHLLLVVKVSGLVFKGSQRLQVSVLRVRLLLLLLAVVEEGIAWLQDLLRLIVAQFHGVLP